MFKAWLEDHKMSDYPLNQRLFPTCSDRAFWEKTIPQSYIKEAEAYLGYEWPLIRATQYMEFYKSGNRLVQETPSFDRRRALIALFLGELAEDKGRFLPDLVDGLFAICEETFWGVSAHRSITRGGELLPSAGDPYIDLFAAETAEAISVIYHILYDRLQAFCPPIIERIEYELDRRIVKPYIDRGDFWWMGYGDGGVNNWLPWILQNVLTVLITANVRASQREYALRKSLIEIQRYYDSIPNDGGCDEGSDYWGSAGARLFMYCDQLYIASGGKIDLFSDEKFKRIGLYIAHAYIADCRFANFADGTGIKKSLSEIYTLHGFGLRIGEDSLCRLAATLMRSQKRLGGQTIARGLSIKKILFSLIYAEEIKALPEYEPSAFCVLPDLQNAFLRKGEWYLAAKGGHNAENHNHNDVGSIIVFADNTPLLVDPGIGTYTRFTFSEQRYTIPGTQSAYHNLPLINGVMQQNGAEFKASRFTADENSVEICFGGAYPAEAGVKEVVRTVTLKTTGVDICDQFAFVGGKAVCEHFMTPLSVEAAGDTAIIDGRYRLRVAGATVSCDKLDFEGDTKYIATWGCEYLTRIKFTINAETVNITLNKLG